MSIRSDINDTTRTIWTSKTPYNSNVWVGEIGQIFYNPTLGCLRLSDGITAGGLPLCGGANGNVGATGANGVSISNATVIGGNLLITFSNSSAVWAGNVVGPQGIQGNIGPQGNVGPQGIQGNIGPQGNVGPAGNTFIGGDYGAFYDVTTQTISNIAAAHKTPIGNTTISSGVSLSSGNIVVSVTGVYDIQYSIQFTNTDNANHDIYVWLRINNIDLPDSNSEFTIHSRNSNPGGAVGKLIAVTPIVTSLNAGDTVQIMWSTDDIGIAITTFAAQTNPTRPRTPGVIVYVNQIA
jgi:hypothetical protein